MMKFNPIKHFTDRAEEIAKFTELVAANSERWVMLVDGLSGTGKTLMLDWLRLNRCDGVPYAKVTLSSNVNVSDLLRSIADQFGSHVAQRYREGILQLDIEEREQPLVQYTPSYVMKAGLGGSIQEGLQQSEVAFDLGSLADLLRLEREAKRLDIFVEAFDDLEDKTWVLFIDEAGYLKNSELRRFILDQLIVRLCTRFPGFRTYITGQSVPRDSFQWHERIDVTLDTLTHEHVSQLLANVGFPSSNVREAVYSATLGHPLLLGMLVEDMLQTDQAIDHDDLTGFGDGFDERMRTGWIYGRILSRIQDPLMNSVAANLSLFEWFDLGLLRSTFGSELAENSFNELVERSFVKSLDKGRWKCHDIIIQHLRPQRENLLGPEETGGIHMRASDAFRSRLASKQNSTGVWDFEGRIDIVSGLLHHALGYSSAEAHAFLGSELGFAFEKYDTDYLYSLVRLLENRIVPDSIAQFARRTREAIEAINLREFRPQLVTFIDDLAKHAIGLGNSAVAAGLSRAAALMAGKLDMHKAAFRLAEQAIAADASPRSYRRAAELAAQGGDTETAEKIILEAESKCGKAADLYIARSHIALALGDKVEAVRLLAEAVAEFPKAHDARLELAFLLFSDEKLEAALAQVDFILVDDPSHRYALALRLELLVRLGKIESAIACARDSNIPLAQMVNSAVAWMGLLANPKIKGRILNEIITDPDSTPTELILQVAQVLSFQGDVDTTTQLTQIVQGRWPEARPVCETHRAMAYLTAGRTEEAKSLIEQLLAQNEGNIDSYTVLSACYAQVNDADNQRAVLEKMAKLFPASRDMADHFIVHSYLAAGSSDPALHYLSEAQKQRTLGPFAQEAWADTHVSRGELPKAVEILEQLIYTSELSNYPMVRLIAIRVKYALLLARTGRRDDAVEVAYGLLNLSVDKRLTASQALVVFLSLEHEEGMRTALHSSNHWTAMDLERIYGALAELSMRRNSTIDGLLAELARHPERTEIVIAIDRILSQTGQLGSYPEVLNEIERLAPGSLVTFQMLQQELMEQVSPEYVYQLRAAKAMMPNNPQLRLALGRIMLAQQRFEDAKAEFDELVAMNPNFEDLVVQEQIKGLISANQLDSAKALLEPYLVHSPLPFPLVEATMSFYQATGDIEAEINLHFSVAESYPLLRQDAYEHIVDIYIDQERYTDALQLIKLLEDERDLQYGIMLSRATALRELGRLDEALLVLDDVLAVPNLSDIIQSVVWYQRGLCLQRGHQFDDALKAFILAANLAQDAAEPHFQIAGISIEQNDWKLAYEALMNGLALEPERLVDYEDTLRMLRERISSAGPDAGVKPHLIGEQQEDL